jgi:hypothetical protein
MSGRPPEDFAGMPVEEVYVRPPFRTLGRLHRLAVEAQQRLLKPGAAVRLLGD